LRLQLVTKIIRINKQTLKLPKYNDFLSMHITFR
jgi:hypothetical protein